MILPQSAQSHCLLSLSRLSLASAGVLIHQFDSVDDWDPAGRPWQVGAGKPEYGDRLSASLVYASMLKDEGGNIPIYSFSTAGFVLSPVQTREKRSAVIYKSGAARCGPGSSVGAVRERVIDKLLFGLSRQDSGEECTHTDPIYRVPRTPHPDCTPILAQAGPILHRSAASHSSIPSCASSLPQGQALDAPLEVRPAALPRRSAARFPNISESSRLFRFSTPRPPWCRRPSPRPPPRWRAAAGRWQSER